MEDYNLFIFSYLFGLVGNLSLCLLFNKGKDNISGSFALMAFMPWINFICVMFFGCFGIIFLVGKLFELVNKND